MDAGTQHILNAPPVLTQALAPAQIWVGNHDGLMEHLEQYLQNLFCLQHGCATCRVCHAIRQHQHHLIMWMHPERHYTTELLAPLFSQISFALEQEQQYFFILQKADTLTATCANSLLKSIEEPPTGYHFIFLTDRIDAVLPTIRSRCTITTLHTNTVSDSSPLFALLTSKELHSPLEFAQVVEESKISERQTMELLDQLLVFWATRYKQAGQKNDPAEKKYSSTMITIVQQALAYPPMPGSSKLFLKNLYLQLKQSTA